MTSQMPVDVNDATKNHFIEKILIDFVDMKEFLFSTLLKKF